MTLPGKTENHDREMGSNEALSLLDLSNPSLDGVYSFLKLAVDNLKKLGVPFKELEARVKDIGQIICNALLRIATSTDNEVFLKLAATIPDEIAGTDKVVRTRSRLRARTISTIFGDIKFERLIYEKPYIMAETLKPFDAILNLPLNSYSPGLTREVCFSAVKTSFKSTSDDLKRHMGVNIPVAKIPDIVMRASTDVDDYLADTSPPGHLPSKETASQHFVCLEFDHKGIPMRIDNLKGQTKENAESLQKSKSKHGLMNERLCGPRKDYKRSATVSVSYTLPKRVRSIEEIIPIQSIKNNQGKLSELKSSLGKNDLSGSTVIEPGRARPQRKRVVASIKRSTEQVIRSCFNQGRKLDPYYKMDWVCLCDGEKSLQAAIEGEAQRRKTKITLVLDIFHVSEYLWESARSLFKDEEKAKRAEWVRLKIKLLLEGCSDKCCNELKANLSTQRKNSAAAKVISKNIGYFTRNKERMKYDEYLKAGYPIASGVAEGACRHIIGDRLDCTGSRWTKDTAEAILGLRSVWASGELDQYLNYHEQCEFQSNYKAKISFPVEFLEVIDAAKSSEQGSFWRGLRSVLEGEPGLKSYST